MLTHMIEHQFYFSLLVRSTWLSRVPGVKIDTENEQQARVCVYIPTVSVWYGAYLTETRSEIPLDRPSYANRRTDDSIYVFNIVL